MESSQTPKRSKFAIYSKDNTIEYSRNPPNKTRTLSKDLIKFTPGLNKKSKLIVDEIDAFSLFMNDRIIELVLKCTNDYADKNQIGLRLTKSLLFQWIGVNLYFELTKSKNMNLQELWGQKYGSAVVKSCMSYQTFVTTKRILRLDIKTCRTQNYEFAPFNDFFHLFSRKIYVHRMSPLNSSLLMSNLSIIEEGVHLKFTSR